MLAQPFPLVGLVICLCHYSSDNMQFRNFNLMAIDYGFRPRLRSRLTLSRLALLRKPWISGLYVSRIYLATHSGILSRVSSTLAPAYASSLHDAPLPLALCLPQFLTKLLAVVRKSIASVVCFSPGTFSAQVLSTSELLRTL